MLSAPTTKEWQIQEEVDFLLTKMHKRALEVVSRERQEFALAIGDHSLFERILRDECIASHVVKSTSGFRFGKCFPAIYGEVCYDIF